MSVVINTNFAATIASSNLAASSSMLQRSLNRLSSGTKIINPSDDAGGLAVSMKLSAAAKRSGAASNNIGNATSYLQQQDGVMKTAGKVLDRMSELWTLYQDATKNTSDKTNYDTEYKALQKELYSLSQEKFNGISLFGSSTSGVVESVKVSEDATQSVQVLAKDLQDTTSGIGTTLSNASGTNSLSSITAISTINNAIQNVATFRANNGAEQSRLGFAAEVLTTNKANLEAANSRIVDVDVAEESTQLARWNVLVQSGTAMLAQANQSAQSALRLIQ
jgi:flagellin